MGELAVYFRESDLLACSHTFCGNSQVGHANSTGLAGWLSTQHHSPSAPVHISLDQPRRQMEKLLRKLTHGASTPESAPTPTLHFYGQQTYAQLYPKSLACNLALSPASGTSCT